VIEVVVLVHSLDILVSVVNGFLLLKRLSLRMLLHLIFWLYVYLWLLHLVILVVIMVLLGMYLWLAYV
jgi:hypothetical protein